MTALSQPLRSILVDSKIPRHHSRGLKSHNISLERSVTIVDPTEKYWTPSFIKMSSPVHAQQRKTVSQIAASENLTKLEGLIRSRVQRLLDGLPRNCFQTEIHFC